jgi:ABC-type Fe3+-hydroxamate transport system substrate-binding protein
MGTHPVKDQMGFEVRLEALPRRIVSLVPSQTELLYDLGLEDRIVGVTKFCVHPDRARKTKTVIGGTKNFDLDRIVSLNPDLVIGNKEENYPEGISFLRERYPVWMSDIATLGDALAMIDAVSQLTGEQAKGTALVQEIREKFGALEKLPGLGALYLMWFNPWMGAASGTFIDAMMREAGLVNALSHRQRYPSLTEDEIRELNPEFVLLSSEPFPFAKKHEAKIRELLPAAKVQFVDGEFFSWYGSRLRLAPDYFEGLRAEFA